jgi:hypothetical protein
VVGLLVGRGEGALQDRRAGAGAGRVLVSEPLLQVVEGVTAPGRREGRGDGGAGPLAGERVARIGLGDTDARLPVRRGTVGRGAVGCSRTAAGARETAGGHWHRAVRGRQAGRESGSGKFFQHSVHMSHGNLYVGVLVLPGA